MNFSLVTASREHQSIISNLMQFYIYDFSEYIEIEVEETGRFGAYPGLEKYWEESNKFPYVIKCDEKYVGFALVKFVQSESRDYFSIAEFFILKKYRLGGIGKSIAIQIFDLHQGEWEVYQKDSNKPARIFWKKVIKEYTKGEFKERAENGKQIQNFKSN